MKDHKLHSNYLNSKKKKDLNKNKQILKCIKYNKFNTT